MQYFFSVVIPIYNSEQFLHQSIHSVLVQKKSNVQIVLINDGSTDESKKICDLYKKKYNFVKVLHHKRNQGVAVSRNNGIRISDGKYIIFLDSDDELFKESLNGLEIVIKARKDPDVIIGRFIKKTFPNSNYNLIKANEKNINNTENFIKYVNKSQFPIGQCWPFIVKKKFLLGNKIIFPRVKIGEDDLYVAKIICLMSSYAFLKKNFYFKKDRDSSLSHSKDFSTTKSTLKLLTQFCLFKNKKKWSKNKNIFIDTFIQNVFGVFSALIILRKKEEVKKISHHLRKKNIKNLIKFPENFSLYNLILKKGSYRGLVEFKNLIINSKLLLIKKLNENYKNLYIYCRSKYAAATIKILKQNGYLIKGVIDDNKSFVQKDFLGYKTISSTEFFKKFKKKLTKSGFIITNQRAKTLQKISSQLLKNGLNKRQILTMKY